MPTKVRGHRRVLSSGKETPVREHWRNVDQTRRRLRKLGVRTKLKRDDPDGFITLNKQIVEVDEVKLKEAKSPYLGKIELTMKTIHIKDPLSEKDDIDTIFDYYIVKTPSKSKKLKGLKIVEKILIGQDEIFISTNRKDAEKIYEGFRDAETRKDYSKVYTKALVKSKKKVFTSGQLKVLLGFFPTTLGRDPNIKPTKYRPARDIPLKL